MDRYFDWLHSMQIHLMTVAGAARLPRH